LWTAIPVAPPEKKLRLRLKDVDKQEARCAVKAGAISFHMAGCSGNHDYLLPQKAVAGAMTRQLKTPGIWGGAPNAPAASFLFHLGDVVYKGGMPEDSERNHQPTLYDEQLYTPYAKYDRSLFAIAGNHDGKLNDDPRKSAIDHFLGNFCGRLRKGDADAGRHGRMPGQQPYPYWVLDTPACYIIGLYANVINAGQLDNPAGNQAPQYAWLIKVLTRIRKKKNGKAVILAVHYPPYSGARDFVQRGDPNIGPTPRLKKMRFLADILQDAFRRSGQIPDIIVSAHAHNYQRLTYRYAGGRELPCLIAGTGGHAEMEPLARTPAGKNVPLGPLPLNAVPPPGFKLPKGDSVKLQCYQDQQPGFLRISVDLKKHTLKGEYFCVPCFAGKEKEIPALFDSFTVDLKKHRIHPARKKAGTS
jgi:hypothetical protein